MLLLCFLMGKLWFSHSSALAMHWQSECSFKQAVYLPRTTCVFADIGPSVSHRELQTYSLQRAEVKLRKVSTATTVCLFWGCCCFFHFWWVFSEILPVLVNSVITLCSCDFGSMHGEKKSDGIFMHQGVFWSSWQANLMCFKSTRCLLSCWVLCVVWKEAWLLKIQTVMENHF